MKVNVTKLKHAEPVESKNIELVKRFYRYLDSKKHDELGELIAPRAKVFYESGDHVTFSEMVPFIKTFYASFPDYKHTVEDIFAVGDKVVARLSFSGTFRNSFMGFDPNGKSFKYAGVHILQFKDGEVSSFWGIEDELGMMTQLGFELKPKKLESFQVNHS